MFKRGVNPLCHYALSIPDGHLLIHMALSFCHSVTYLAAPIHTYINTQIHWAATYRQDCDTAVWLATPASFPVCTDSSAAAKCRHGNVWWGGVA